MVSERGQWSYRGGRILIIFPADCREGIVTKLSYYVKEIARISSDASVVANSLQSKATPAPVKCPQWRQTFLTLLQQKCESIDYLFIHSVGSHLKTLIEWKSPCVPPSASRWDTKLPKQLLPEPCDLGLRPLTLTYDFVAHHKHPIKFSLECMTDNIQHHPAHPYWKAYQDNILPFQIWVLWTSSRRVLVKISFYF